MSITNGAGMARGSRKFSPEELEDLREMESNGRWFDENLPALTKKYPERFVAVHRERVLAASRTLDGLFSTLRKPGVPRMNQVLVRYVPDKDTIVIY